MKVRSLGDEEWNGHIGEQVRCMLGEKYNRIKGHITGKLVKVEQYKLHIVTSGGVEHTVFKVNCELVEEA